MNEQAHLSDLVLENTAAATVFERHRLDFCCHGKRPLAAACAEKGLDPQAVIAEIAALAPVDSPAVESDNVDLIALLADIVGRHHTYVKRMLPVLSQHVAKVAKVHGANHPELHDVARLWAAVNDELASHLIKEERVLFPYIESLVGAREAGSDLPPCCFDTVASPIQVMEMEHDHAGEALEAIRELTADYTPPANACTTYQLTLRELREFTEDLHLHIHKENNLLHPRAIALEAELATAAHG